MSQAVRAIIIEAGNMLVMRRNKYGDEYYTLVGGRIDAGETPEQALVREIKEETGLDIIKAQLVFVEKHPAPYNEQFIYHCEVAQHGEVAIQATAEEALMNRIDLNTHAPLWVPESNFAHLAFRTPQLQAAILQALAQGFPAEPRQL